MHDFKQFGKTQDVASADPLEGWLRRFFVRQDPIYEHYAEVGQARSSSAKLFYLLMHLLPGVTAWAFINVSSIYSAELRLTGLSGRYLQYSWLIVITFGWHILFPLLVLHFHDGLN